MTFVHVCLKNDVSFFLAKPLRIQNILSHKTFYGLGKTFFKIALLILSKCISGKNLCNKENHPMGFWNFFQFVYWWCVKNDIDVIVSFTNTR